MGKVVQAICVAIVFLSHMWRWRALSWTVSTPIFIYTGIDGTSLRSPQGHSRDSTETFMRECAMIKIVVVNRYNYSRTRFMRIWAALETKTIQLDFYGQTIQN